MPLLGRASAERTLRERHRIESILARRDLYAEQYIQNHQVLRDLLHEVLNDEDWEEIASAAEAGSTGECFECLS